jgi:2,4'-dihydroxyacetophenone dioxygenase
MPITKFAAFSDGLEPKQRHRDHYIADIDLDDDRLWVPWGDTKGVWFQPCCSNVTAGGFSIVVKGLPGAVLGTHYHVGDVYGMNMRGLWRYLESEWIAKPGTFIYEPAGEAHTLVVLEDSPESMMAFFVVRGALVYMEPDGTFKSYEDAFTFMEMARKHWRDKGLDVALLEERIR